MENIEIGQKYTYYFGDIGERPVRGYDDHDGQVVTVTGAVDMTKHRFDRRWLSPRYWIEAEDGWVGVAENYDLFPVGYVLGATMV